MVLVLHLMVQFGQVRFVRKTQLSIQKEIRIGESGEILQGVKEKRMKDG